MSGNEYYNRLRYSLGLLTTSLTTAHVSASKLKTRLTQVNLYLRSPGFMIVLEIAPEVKYHPIAQPIRKALFFFPFPCCEKKNV